MSVPGTPPDHEPDTKKGASLAEVAKAAGVSRMTVSRVMRNEGRVADETRRRVLAEVERLGYVPNRIAAAFSADRASTLVGVCIPRLTSALFGELLESIDRALSRLGFQTMIGAHEDDPAAEAAWLRELLAWRPAGVLLTGRVHTPGATDMLRAATIPMVEMWDLNTTPLDVSIGLNHYDSGAEMARFMLSRGRRRIGYVGTARSPQTLAVKRASGFSDALRGAGVALQGSECLNDGASFYAGYYGMETLLNRVTNLDAIYCQNDEMAIGSLAYCSARGVRVPDDIGVAGWGGYQAAAILPRLLTTTAVPTRRIGKLSAEALVARLRGEPVADVQLVPAVLRPGATV
ncbi:MAG: LacI family DNA-binding transcriptional regulator [Pseudomonadota bacterium]